MKIKELSMKKFSLLVVAALSLSLMTGCGGGGGGGGTALNPPSQSNNNGGNSVATATGELNVSVKFPPQADQRSASLVPADTATILVAAHPVQNGRAASTASGSVVLNRPSPTGGEVGGQLVLGIGRYEIRILAKKLCRGSSSLQH